MFAPIDQPAACRPLLVMAYGDSLYAALSGRHFRRLGWEVHLAGSGPELRRLVHALNPAVVVIDTDLRDESGWLTCDKLSRACPAPKVILVSPDPTDENRRLAEFVGAAALVCRGGGVQALVEEIGEASLQAVG